MTIVSITKEGMKITRVTCASVTSLVLLNIQSNTVDARWFNYHVLPRKECLVLTNWILVISEQWIFINLWHIKV